MGPGGGSAAGQYWRHPGAGVGAWRDCTPRWFTLSPLWPARPSPALRVRWANGWETPLGATEPRPVGAGPACPPQQGARPGMGEPAPRPRVPTPPRCLNVAVLGGQTGKTSLGENGCGGWIRGPEAARAARRIATIACWLSCVPRPGRAAGFAPCPPPDWTAAWIRIGGQGCRIGGPRGRWGQKGHARMRTCPARSGCLAGSAAAPPTPPRRPPTHPPAPLSPPSHAPQ